ncbi:uncharacterized protein LOC110709277 [Chenopodium quinoa]|uniref:uncharacterized protein LOC110709277 n=1 Tax=Chenopodium quinoa TaxID=63459 RepID=UPI000B787FD9|nr:uncharacterized protein LOC110709277 [Chenopodium quinoa]
MTKTRKQSKANCVRSSQQTVEEKSGSSMFGDTTKGPKFVQLHSTIFKDNRLSVGGQVKAKGEVLKYHSSSRTKAPNLTCRIESFGRICQKFDDRRKKWVGEMGFGGLLFLDSGMHLPRQLVYWLLSRIDPIKKMLICLDGTEFKLSQNQVYWIFGIPNGGKAVPSKSRMNDHVKGDVEELLRKYG